MASKLRRIGPATIRPHYKTHRSPDLTRRQVQAGAGGLSMATVREAAVLAGDGSDDLFIVNTVAHPDKIRLLAELARDRRILVAVDEAENAAAHFAAGVRAGSTVGIFVEVDTGMNRCGIDTPEEALARQISELPGLRFEGITGCEGHCTLTPEKDLRHEKEQVVPRQTQKQQKSWTAGEDQHTDNARYRALSGTRRYDYYDGRARLVISKDARELG